VAKPGFGNPKVKKGPDKYACPNCGKELTLAKYRGSMVYTCSTSPKKVKEYKDNALCTGPFLKGHNNFDAGCNVSIPVAEARKVLKEFKK
jgi:predicted RNA-binding Zn-ribbon protein involved in translation (DUF1610 family)